MGMASGCPSMLCSFVYLLYFFSDPVASQGVCEASNLIVIANTIPVPVVSLQQPLCFGCLFTMGLTTFPIPLGTEWAVLGSDSSTTPLTNKTTLGGVTLSGSNGTILLESPSSLLTFDTSRIRCDYTNPANVKLSITTTLTEADLYPPMIEGVNDAGETFATVGETVTLMCTNEDNLNLQEEFRWFNSDGVLLDLFGITRPHVMTIENVTPDDSGVYICEVSIPGVQLTVNTTLIVHSMLPSLIPTSMTVKAYEIAFFPCHLPGRGQPLWIINGTEYFSADLIPDHTTNITGLIVYVRPEYNNTLYECRYVELRLADKVFLDKDIETSPTARLTVTEGTNPLAFDCERAIPIQSTYDQTTQLLTITLEQNLTNASAISLYSCSNGEAKEFRYQDCSSIPLNLGPVVANASIIVTISPACTGVPPPLDYSILIATDFNFISKRNDLLSVVQQVEVSGKCLESSLFGADQFRITDLQISISANGMSSYVSFANQDFFDLRIEKEVLFVCFLSKDVIQSIVGNVKEAVVQEVGSVNPNHLCNIPQTSGESTYALLFGSKGILSLDSSGEELEHSTVCTSGGSPGLSPSDDTRECILFSPLVVIPNKSPGLLNTIGYNFHGTCEHVLVTPCNADTYEVVGDFLESDLSLGRVGLRLSGYTAIIDEDLIIIEVGIKPDNVMISLSENLTSVTLFDGSSLVVSMVHTVDQIVITSNVSSGELCGLCGSINGSLITSDGVKVKDYANKLEIDVFASSWLVEPSKQILHEYRRECVVVRSDTVIGDPLLQAPLWMEDSEEITSLCYEVHGRSATYFNLVSDECVLVNSLFTLKDGLNVVTEIGVRAVTENLEGCMSVLIRLSNNMCKTAVIYDNDSSIDLNIGDVYDESGIQVHQQNPNRVHISVPNCELLNLIMLVTCEISNNISMIHFNISRGVNLRPTSHGLLGQFWNIPVSAVKLTNPTLLAQLPQPNYDHNTLYMVTVKPVDSPDRTFLGELFGYHWDSYKSPCLYAGNSQGGKSGELQEISDSVIEGKFTDYIVSGTFSHSFSYSKFENEKCTSTNSS